MNDKQPLPPGWTRCSDVVVERSPTIQLRRGNNTIAIYGGETPYTSDRPYEINLATLDATSATVEARLKWATRWMAHLSEKVWFVGSGCHFDLANVLAEAAARPVLDRLSEV